MHVEDRKCVQNFSRKTSKEDLDVDGRPAKNPKPKLNAADTMTQNSGQREDEVESFGMVESRPNILVFLVPNYHIVEGTEIDFTAG
jgi:hypothetical protein